MAERDAAGGFGALRERVRDVVAAAAGARDDALLRLCRLLADVPAFDWVGFYLADPAARMLVLGPFVGEPTEHVRIPYGRGICGQAAERGETFLVQDVSREGNYLACSIRVKAEIVVPVLCHGRFVAELDIDSHTAAPFTPAHRALVEDVALAAGRLFER